jgi:hypothetical protein
MSACYQVARMKFHTFCLALDHNAPNRIVLDRLLRYPPGAPPPTANASPKKSSRRRSNRTQDDARRAHIPAGAPRIFLSYSPERSEGVRPQHLLLRSRPRRRTGSRRCCHCWLHSQLLQQHRRRRRPRRGRLWQPRPAAGAARVLPASPRWAVCLANWLLKHLLLSFASFSIQRYRFHSLPI